MLDPQELGLAHHARTFHSKPALVMGERQVTYGTLNARVNRLARALRRVGVGVGDAVGAALHNGFEWFELLNAVGKLGAQLVPIGYRLKAPEIAYMLADSRAKVLIGAEDLRDEIGRAFTELNWTDERLWTVQGDHSFRSATSKVPSPLAGEGQGEGAPRARPYEDVLAAESEAEPGDAFIGGGYNTLIYTSGTTGRPKGIERPADPINGHLMFAGIAQMWGIGADDIHLVTGPLYHTAPSSYGQLHLLVGATVILMSHFDAAEALRLIERHHVTTTFMVPTHFNRILQLDSAQRGRDLSSLRLVLHSAAPCPAHVKRGIVEIFPPGVVTEFYGASESGFTKITAEEWLRKPGSVGKPWPGHEIKILDEAGKELPRGDIGLIYVNSPRLDFRYRAAEEKNRAAFRDGFFTAGDLGYLDDDGYLFIADRRTDLIISGGANIYPAEVEAVLLQHPQVADAAVIGVPDVDMGKLVLAVVELRAGETATADEIIASARRELAHYKCPKRVVFVDELPREPQGKVRKHELIAQYGAG